MSSLHDHLWQEIQSRRAGQAREPSARAVQLLGALAGDAIDASTIDPHIELRAWWRVVVTAPTNVDVRELVVLAEPGPNVSRAIAELIDTGTPFATPLAEHTAALPLAELERLLGCWLWLAEADTYEWRRERRADFGDHRDIVDERMARLGLSELEIDAADADIRLPDNRRDLDPESRRNHLERLLSRP
jgi:hypothetical protein